MSGEDRLLLGIDMIKSKGILEKAYNDSSNVTACFNKNILNVINSKTGTNFNPQSFEHNAFFNQEESRIEMHLRALTDSDIFCPSRNLKIKISYGESIHTENSHKFAISQINTQIKSGGLKINSITTDHNNWFSLLLIAKGK